MKIGILNAISPASSKIDWGGSPVDTYMRFIQGTGASFTGVGYSVSQGQLPASPDACDAYIITGSPSGAYDADPWIADLTQFIRSGVQAGQKFVGICFGHQILAHALGGHVEQSEKGWGLGLQGLAVNQPKPWMKIHPQQLSLYFAHQDQVKRLPPEAELLGGSEFCPIGIYSIRDQVFGIQGHPEFSRQIMDDIINGRKQQGDLTLATTAAASLNSGTPDNQLVAHWIVNFLGLKDLAG